MGSPKESLEQKNIFTEKYDEIRRLDGTVYMMMNVLNEEANMFAANVFFPF
jgi:hypothetical protein